MRLQHIENIVPELGTFYDTITAKDLEPGFHAFEALQKFTKLYGGLPESVLSQEIDTFMWKEGVQIYISGFDTQLMGNFKVSGKGRVGIHATSASDVSLNKSAWVGTRK